MKRDVEVKVAMTPGSQLGNELVGREMTATEIAKGDAWQARIKAAEFAKTRKLMRVIEEPPSTPEGREWGAEWVNLHALHLAINTYSHLCLHPKALAEMLQRTAANIENRYLAEPW